MADRIKSSQSAKPSDRDSQESAPAKGATPAASSVRRLISHASAASADTLTSDEAGALQSTIGNRAVGRLFSERSSAPAAPAPVQRQAGSPAQAGTVASNASAHSNHTGIPTPVLRGMESYFGQDFSGVRVHANSSSAPAMNALGYTRGSEVHFAPGLYNPHTSEGLSLLGHELTHVVQQREGRVRATAQMKNGMMLNDDHALEREADERGARAAATLQMKSSVRPVRVEASADGEQGEGGVSQLSANRECSVVAQRAAADGIVQMARTKTSGKGTSEGAADDTATQQYFDAVSAHNVMANAQALIAQALLAMQQPTATPPTTTTTGTDGTEAMDIDMTQQKRAGEPVVQLAATATGYGGGTMNEHAAQPHVGVVNNAALATINWGNTRAFSNTSTHMDAIDLNTHPGGVGVGATRPNNWAQFVAMINGNNVFVQGHTLHEDLGGDNNNDNLSPFTHSLNSLHYHRVEKHILNQTNNHFADYDVDINYTGNANIATWARGQFNGMTWQNQNTAMVGAGVITAAQAAANVLAGAVPAGQLVNGRTWINNYVNNTFPSDIDCAATFIDDQGGGNYTQSAQQAVNITNDF